MTAPRIIVRGATTAITRRTVLRKAFLAPWHDDVDNLILYAMADAQAETGVAIHSSVRNVTHHHTTGTPSRDNLPDFTRRFHRDVTCSLQVLLRRERYDAPREIFDDRPAHMMRLVDAEAQASHHTYEVLNPVAAGLVERPSYMPMTRVDYTVWKKGYIEVERPSFYFGSDRPEVHRLVVTPPPLLYEAFGGDLEKLIYYMQKLERAGLDALHQVRTFPFMGAQALRRVHPWDEPRTFREVGGERVPTFKIGASAVVGGNEARREAAKEVAYFRREHETARMHRRDGDFQQRFPYGTYAMRVYRGAPVEEQAFVDAIVTAPGPTLEEVKERLARERVDQDAVRERSHAVVDAVRDAFRAEASEIAEDSMIDLAEPKVASRPRAESSSVNGAARAAEVASSEADADTRVTVRHNGKKRRYSKARRVVTRRDCRRGRPPGSGGGAGKRGSDPPE